MDIFETKIRGFHAKTIENIMARSTGKLRKGTSEKNSAKTDNISTYLRKFEVDRENLNLAKRIILCESEHNHKKYKRQWKKTQNFIRVRSNFKRSLCNEEPRIFKFEPITGQGNLLVSLSFKEANLSPISFRPQNLYELKVLTNKTALVPTNNHFTLQTLSSKAMAFYVHKKKKQATCKITELKENNTYEKGKFQINLGEQGEQKVYITNSQGKPQGVLTVHLNVYSKKDMKSRTGISLVNTASNFHKRNESQL